MKRKEKSRQAVAFQLDPLSNKRFIELGRPADKLFYSHISTPTNPLPHEHGIDAKMSLSEHQRMIDRCLGGEEFEMTVTKNPDGLVVARVEVPPNTMESTALEKYARWALMREGHPVDEDALPDLSRQIDVESEGQERLLEAASWISVNTLSVRCLGLKIKGLPPVGRERLQVIDGERKI